MQRDEDRKCLERICEGIVTHLGDIVGSNKNIDVVGCGSCNFIHQIPIPDNRKYYKRQFLAVDKPHYLRNMERDTKWHNMRYEMELRTLRQTGLKGGELLDVGCGFGQYMEYAQMLGWSVHGIEPADFACSILHQKKLDFRQGWIEEEGIKENSLDLVRMGWVLEHLADPFEVLKSLYRSLVPGGFLVLIVPNDFTNLQLAAASKLDSNMWWIDRSHINYFSAPSLVELCKRVGFVPTAGYSTFPMELFLLAGLDYVNHPWLGNVAHRIRVNIEMSLYKYQPSMTSLFNFGAGLFTQGLGRDLVCVFKK